MSKHKTQEDLLQELINNSNTYPSDALFAKAFNISRGHMSRVLRGIKPITAKIALGLGYEEQKCYIKFEERK